MPRVDHFERCPMPVSGGGDCWAEPHPASRHGLCVAHWREVVEDWVGDAPTVSRMCPACGILNVLDPVDWASARCFKCGEPMSAPWLVTEQRIYQESITNAKVDARGVVYYVRLGDLVKIGFSSSFQKRMEVIPHTEVLATEPGGYDLERARHRQFETSRVDGMNEWFSASADLLEHAAALRAEHGDPHALADRIEAQHVHAEVVREFGSEERLQAELNAWKVRQDG